MYTLESISDSNQEIVSVSSDLKKIKTEFFC